MMRWLLDENIPAAFGATLVEYGHDVLFVARDSPGASDAHVLEMCRAQNRTLVSFDRDHGDLIFGRGAVAPRGVVYLRIGRPQREQIQVLAAALASMAPEVLDGYFTVITLGGIRQRRLPNTL